MKKMETKPPYTDETRLAPAKDHTITTTSTTTTTITIMMIIEILLGYISPVHNVNFIALIFDE